MWLLIVWETELVGRVLYPWPWQPSLLETSLCSSPSSRSLSSAVNESGSSTFCRGCRRKEEGREDSLRTWQLWYHHWNIFKQVSHLQHQPLLLILVSYLLGCFKKSINWWKSRIFRIKSAWNTVTCAVSVWYCANWDLKYYIIVFSTSMCTCSINHLGQTIVCTAKSRKTTLHTVSFNCITFRHKINKTFI